MAKVKKCTVWKNVCLMIALIFAIGALSMLFFEMIHNVKTGATYKGYDIAFCCIEGDQFLGNIANPDKNIVKIVWGFSFGNFMAYFSLILAVICCVGAMAYKKQGLVLSVLTMLLFFSAGIAFINQVGNLQPYVDGIRTSMENTGYYTVEQINGTINNYILSVRADYQLSWAAYLAAGCSFVAGISALLSKIMWQVYHNR